MPPAAHAPRPCAALTIHNAEYTAHVTPAGVELTRAGAPARLVKWENIADAPSAYAVIADGWLVATYDTERGAMDRAADLRANGADVSTVRVPAGVTITMP